MGPWYDLEMDIVVSMPDPVARQWGETPQAIGRHVIEDAVIERYRTGRLSHRQVGEALGLDYWQTETFLAARGVPVNYSSTELEADEATLARLTDSSERRGRHAAIRG
jgi:predicted HTH domain antitoxin